ncbi:uncharacterized protein BJ212DRAFT_1317122 [Suillus subaureus]|uniref:Uncharacterized protein n=1 Tax=Suillus subaureus TaxID=48587 RepID=A0A9P7EMV5_9AGAM|nr:uncharacterized protein BJ212DRAFT_1317122 [Suillus subaureus]KAG1825948.1 hypothetical protein BJ212DRAFT_1317122 [Suillus subaureus]
MSSSFASSFAPYTPPPDDSSYRSAISSNSKARPWFPVHSSSRGTEISYQSGGLPTFNNSISGHEDVQQDLWETSYGLRVDVLSAFAYILGPISALILLVLETHNDYVRFHAYQSALLMTPLLLVRIFASLLGFPSWMRSFLTITFALSALFMAVRAYLGASREGLTRYHLPRIGPLAERWVFEE